MKLELSETEKQNPAQGTIKIEIDFRQVNWFKRRKNVNDSKTQSTNFNLLLRVA